MGARAPRGPEESTNARESARIFTFFFVIEGGSGVRWSTVDRRWGEMAEGKGRIEKKNIWRGACMYRAILGHKMRIVLEENRGGIFFFLGVGKGERF